jgi:hypothetical protein
MQKKLIAMIFKVYFLFSIYIIKEVYNAFTFGNEQVKIKTIYEEVD